MRLLTVQVSDGQYRLHLEISSGFVNLDEVAARFDEPALRGILDVGALFRADRSVREAVERNAARLADQELPTKPLDALRPAPPVLAPSKIICVGHNYRAHIEEGGQQIPEEPLLFAKSNNTLVGHDEPIRYPAITQQLDYEGELALVISRRAFNVTEDDAMEYVGGFTIFNDVSARDLQHGVSQWFLGKSLDTFGPIGPCLVTVDDMGPYSSLHLQTRVNGEVRQDASCADMIFSPSVLVAFITRGITLEPGDIIATGTPSGVGLGFRPPRYLNVGDVVEISITKIGTLRSPVAHG